MDCGRTTYRGDDRPAAMRSALRGTSILALTVLVSGMFAATAQAQNLVVNGTFSQAVIGGVTQAAEAAEFGSTNNGFTPAQTLVGWSTAGYNFVYLPNTADTTGATGQATVRLWGPANGGTNAALLPLCAPTSGACTAGSGNYIGADGAYEVSAITQTINGLTAGKSYAVSFAWAGAQQSGFSGATTDEWTVSLGTVSVSNPSQTTSLVSLPTEGASAWVNQTFDFIATGPSELLSFLATGTPTGQPPFALLANVSMTQVPEPASLALMATGLVGLVAAARRHRMRGRTTV
ncbi:PEP-CTERM sorting domain-containing protein [Acidisphaera sp. S103]|uniref:PEP-CTERM sorting domain-containing protein n=1 Tax=Acidisphaera sp. S103 TaxID=1747223 RepID=UPI00131AE9FC|nr:PEP-CTERM sorting domain-containing protein [Acidisphaera sp. S103]